MSTPSFPFVPNWTAQELADAVALRLFEVFPFEAPTDLASNCAGARDWRRREYVRNCPRSCGLV